MSDKENVTAEVVEALRSIADMVEAVPDLAHVVRNALINPHGYVGYKYEDKPAALGMFARAALKHGAKVEKDGDDKWSSVNATWGPITFSAYAGRDEVCERVVVGTETVTKTVKDPAKLAEVPEIEVTEEVEIVEWQCKPLLAADSGGES